MTYSKSLYPTHCYSFKNNAQLPVNMRLCFSCMWMQSIGSLPRLFWSQTRWAVKALPTELPWSSPFSTVSPRASWSLVCKTCEEKHWIWDSKRDQTNVFLETATFVPSCPWRCSPLPSLTNVQTTVQRHCPEQVVWTLGRRGRISRSFHLVLKILSRSLGKASLPAPGVAFGFPPWILLHCLRHTQGLWFPVLTWHICCRLGNWQWI